ncbi:cytochrome P450 [Phaeacidiphilus oryzae]|uniref:cytochrome P450 n=1 Tax=Phaeacidiphilus oryzae TaxID=348818 RepID=UPI00068CBFB3|nr:cytochrome P450 [Phaeacidiphilus oryzae]
MTAAAVPAPVPAPADVPVTRGPRGWPLIGSLPEFSRDPLAFFCRLRDQGDWVEWRLGPQRNILLSRPEQVNEVLGGMEQVFTRNELGWAFRRVMGDSVVVSRGADWRRKRALVQPAVRPRQVKAYADTMVSCAHALAEGWRPGERIDVQREMTALTRRIAVRTIFGVETEGREEVIAQAMADSQEEIGAELRGATMYLPPWVPTSGRARLKDAVARLDEEIERVVAEHRAAEARRDGAERDDLLSRLLAARDEEGVPLSGKELRDEAVTFYIGGHETTSTALTWLWYLLSRSPEARERLDAELAEVLDGGERLPEFADYPRLTWTQQLVKEALRLYPPIWLATSVALDGASVGGRPIAPGTHVWSSMWSVQRDPRWFARPDEFRPERWDPDAGPGETTDHAWYPFGGGQRTCLGARFAQVEAVLIVAVLARRFRLETGPEVRPAPVPRLTLQPSTPIPATLAGV